MKISGILYGTIACHVCSDFMLKLMLQIHGMQFSNEWTTEHFGFYAVQYSAKVSLGLSQSDCDYIQ